LLTNSTFEFIENTDRQDNAAALVESFQALIGKFGMTSFMMGNPSHPQVYREDRLWATTWPEEWLRHWSDQNYISIDPVVNRLLTSNKPLRWVQAGDISDETTAHVLEEAREFRMKAGFALPIYSREGFVVAISMDAEHYELGKAEEACLHMAAIYFHAKLERLRARTMAPKRESRLTRRERECLSWVASGKTDWEISQILRIAEQTVHEYVQNALIKLNATTRAQAVAIGIITKQIAT
jgi:LuxR family transcriptional regulator, quorum-sensing system regulator BjaR1